MRKVEVYSIGKCPPLTVVECDNWEVDFNLTPRVKFFKDKELIAEFFVNNIAGFKEVK